MGLTGPTVTNWGLDRVRVVVEGTQDVQDRGTRSASVAAGSTRRDLDGSDLMLLLCVSFAVDDNDDQQTPRAPLGLWETQKFVAGSGALPYAGESDSGPSSPARPPV